MPHKIQRLDHLAVAVPDLEQAVRLYEQLLGIAPDAVEEVPDQKVRVALYRIGETRIELLAPTSDTSPISGFLAKRGGGLHHLCLEVSDLDGMLAELRAKGVRLIDETPRPGAEGKRVAFVHPQSLGGVLLELTESPRVTPCVHTRAPHTGPSGPHG
jgi:methylmalonyl-CoA/ethylmalonyl-CoA epimerase